MERAVSCDQHDHDVDGRQRDDHHGPATYRLGPEIDDEPLARRAGLPRQLAALEPHAERNGQQAEHEERRQRHEDDEAGVRIVEKTDQQRDEQGDEPYGAGRGQDDARQGDGMAGRARLHTRLLYFFKLCM